MSLDEDFINEVRRLQSRKRVTMRDLKSSMYSEQFNNIQKLYNSKNPRHILYHAINPDVPLCHCGNKLQWHQTTYRNFCSVKCINTSPETKTKIRETCINRYGTSSPAKSEIVKQKMVSTCIERYGVSHISKSSEIINKKKNSLLDKHGVTSSLQIPENIKKSQETMIKKYGVTHPAKSKIIQEKIRETNQNRYGVNNPFQSNDIKEKMKQTWLNKYGVNHPQKCKEISQKTSETWKKRTKNLEFMAKINNKKMTTYMNKYGIEHPSKIHYSKDAVEFLTDDVLFANLVSMYSMAYLADKFGISTYPIYCKMKKLGLSPAKTINSQFETEVLEFIKTHYSDTVITNARTLISPLEVDIYLPKINLAIECNGTYWHSELNGKKRDYHLNKTLLCAEKGVKLFHIWEHIWETKKEIVQSMLLSRMGLSKRIYARKCDVGLVSAQAANEFFNNTHIQGTCGSNVRIGLTYDNELVACMSFGKPRYNKEYEFELIRFSTKTGYNIIGGASKMFNHFLKIYSPNSIISYSDRSSGTGEVYTKLGFAKNGSSSPSYYYTSDYYNFHNRVQFQKHKLKTLLKIYDPALTEWENMKNNGYDRIWDCGNDIFVWKANLER